MADESTIGDAWIFATLSADAPLAAAAPGGIHADIAPRGATPPYVIFQYMTGSDTIGATEFTRIMHRGIWVVKGIAIGSSWQGALRTIANRIDALLHASAGGTVSGGVVFTSYREAPFRMLEERDGVQYRHLGGRYRLLIQGS